MNNPEDIKLIISNDNEATEEQKLIASGLGIKICNAEKLSTCQDAIISEHCFMTGEIPLSEIEKSYLLIENMAICPAEISECRWEFFITAMNISKHIFLTNRRWLGFFENLVPEKVSWLGMAFTHKQTCTNDKNHNNNKILFIDNKKEFSSQNVLSILQRNLPDIEFIKTCAEEITNGKKTFPECNVAINFCNKKSSGIENLYLADNGIACIGSRQSYIHREIFPEINFHFIEEYNDIINTTERLLHNEAYHQYIMEKARTIIAEKFSANSLRKRFFKIYDNITRKGH